MANVATSKADIYSVGSMLYLMEFGHFFVQKPPTEFLRRPDPPIETSAGGFPLCYKAGMYASDPNALIGNTNPLHYLLFHMVHTDPSQRFSVDQIKAHPYFKEV